VGVGVVAGGSIGRWLCRGGVAVGVLEVDVARLTGEVETVDLGVLDCKGDGLGDVNGGPAGERDASGVEDVFLSGADLPRASVTTFPARRERIRSVSPTHLLRCWVAAFL
jgi:hypothetical protein